MAVRMRSVVAGSLHLDGIAVEALDVGENPVEERVGTKPVRFGLEVGEDAMPEGGFH